MWKLRVVWSDDSDVQTYEITRTHLPSIDWNDFCKGDFILVFAEGWRTPNQAKSDEVARRVGGNIVFSVTEAETSWSLVLFAIPDSPLDIRRRIKSVLKANVLAESLDQADELLCFNIRTAAPPKSRGAVKVKRSHSALQSRDRNQLIENIVDIGDIMETDAELQKVIRKAKKLKTDLSMEIMKIYALSERKVEEIKEACSKIEDD